MVDPGCSPGAERSPGAASTITDGSLSLADLAGELVCEEEHSSRRDRAETGESLPDWLRNAEGALKGTDDAGSDGSSQGELPEWLRDAEGDLASSGTQGQRASSSTEELGPSPAERALVAGGAVHRTPSLPPAATVGPGASPHDAEARAAALAAELERVKAEHAAQAERAARAEAMAERAEAMLTAERLRGRAAGDHPPSSAHVAAAPPDLETALSAASPPDPAPSTAGVAGGESTMPPPPPAAELPVAPERSSPSSAVPTAQALPTADSTDERGIIDLVSVRFDGAGSGATGDETRLLQIVGEVLTLLDVDDGTVARRWTMAQISDLDVDDETVSIQFGPPPPPMTATTSSARRLSLVDMSSEAKRIARRLSSSETSALSEARRIAHLSHLHPSPRRHPPSPSLALAHPHPRPHPHRRHPRLALAPAQAKKLARRLSSSVSRRAGGASDSLPSGPTAPPTPIAAGTSPPAGNPNTAGAPSRRSLVDRAGLRSVIGRTAGGSSAGGSSAAAERVDISFATSERAEEIGRLLEAGPNLYWPSN